MIWIYLYTNKLTGEKYIGQTCNIQRRQWEHKSCHGGCREFHKAIRQYGYENFELSILAQGEDNERDWDTVEKEYIIQHQSHIKGYNLFTPGTPKNKAKQRENLSKSLMGHVISDETKKKISDGQRKTKVAIDDIEFDSIRDAAEYFGFDKRCLAYCLKRNKYPVYKGHKIKYL